LLDDGEGSLYLWGIADLKNYNFSPKMPRGGKDATRLLGLFVF
jgi:hypothetical protein